MTSVSPVSSQGAASAGTPGTSAATGKSAGGEGGFATLFAMIGNAVGKIAEGAVGGGKSVTAAEGPVLVLPLVDADHLPDREGPAEGRLRPAWLNPATVPADSTRGASEPKAEGEAPEGAVSVLAADETAAPLDEAGDSPVAEVASQTKGDAAKGTASTLLDAKPATPDEAEAAALARGDADEVIDPLSVETKAQKVSRKPVQDESDTAPGESAEAIAKAQLAAATGAPAAQPVETSRAANSTVVGAVSADGAAPRQTTVAADPVRPQVVAQANAQTIAQNQTDADGGAGDEGSPADSRTAQRMAAMARRAAAEGSAESGPEADTAISFHEIMRTLPASIQAPLDNGPAMLNSISGPLAASAASQLGDKMIDMSVKGQWIDRMASEISALADGTGHSRFQLSPPNLGRIQIDLWQGDDVTNVRLLTETDEAARRLREGQTGLEAHARMASLQLGQVSVEKSQTPLDQNRDQANQQNQQQARQGGDANAQGGGQGQSHAQNDQGGSRSGLNQQGGRAVMGQDRPGELAPDAAPAQAADPRVRFA